MSTNKKEFDPFISGQPILLYKMPEFMKNMRDATPEEEQSAQDYLDEISVKTGVNFNDYLGDE